jgi:hypothetical protein
VTVVVFELGRRLVVELAVQPLLVEPRHPGAGGDFKVIEPFPGRPGDRRSGEATPGLCDLGL